MTRRKHYEDEEPQDEMEPQPSEETVIQPGCNEPGTVPPSVSGTTQDPKHKDKPQHQKED